MHGTYMIAFNEGRIHEAIKNYKKSLELDPGNDNAVKMLNRIMEKIGSQLKKLRRK